MEVGDNKGLNIGSNPFYRPSNSSYGSAWMASQGNNPVKMEAIPLYSDVVSSRSLALSPSSELCNSQFNLHFL